MSGTRPLKIVLLGIMSRMPFGGLVWGTIQYLVGFERLGHEVYYVEAHGSTPRMFIDKVGDDAWARAAAFIDGVMQRLDLRDRWAFHAVHDGRRFGMSASQLKELYDSADLIINLHGSTQPLDEHSATGRLLYLDTDPGEAQIEADRQSPPVLQFLGRHSAFFTWALNYGRPDCGLPVTAPFDFRPTPPPIVPDVWKTFAGNGPGPLMTTVGNWRQNGCDIAYRGEVYRWSKHHEFLKFIDLPRRTSQQFELALSSCTEADRNLLEGHGWRVREAMGFSRDLDAYRDYIVGSRGEFTVAKDRNVRLRSGWFSERSASYLAAGRPVITQDTGFGNVLPTGEGLFSFSTAEQALEAVDRIGADYTQHAEAARRIAREYFGYDVVLPRLLRDLGFAASTGAARQPRAADGELPHAREAPWTQLDDLILDFEAATGRTPSLLDWHSRFDVAARLPAQAVFQPPMANAANLPYLDGTVDFVIVNGDEPEKLDHARRVATSAVLVLRRDSPRPPSLTVLWRDQPGVAGPMVSIVVPITEQRPAWWEPDLLRNLPSTVDVEVVVACSETCDRLPDSVESPARPRVSLTVARVPTRSLSALCNEGARLASGDVLAFLIPDASPLGAWVRPLSRTLEAPLNAAVVFPMVLYPDGRLREAGRLMVGPGKAIALGDGEAPDLADYHYVNDVDSGSGVFVGTTRKVFADVGGFDVAASNFDEAVARYCAAVRDRGLRILYQPEIVVACGAHA